LLRAGFSKVCISPPLGAPLAGFAARLGVSEGIHDDLFARALVITNDDDTIALVSLDVLALPDVFVRRVRESIHAITGIGADSVMIASTHTHAGPVTITTFFNPEETVNNAYMDSLARAVDEAVTAAWRGSFPARIGVSAGRVGGIGVNRRTPDQRPVDEEIGIIKVEDKGGALRGVFVNYACHPTVLGSNNLLISGDFPNFTIQRIEETIGPGSFAMFVNGTQGNISMGHSSELSAIGVITPGRTFEHAQELGHLLADATLAALPDIRTDETATIGALNIRVNLPLKDYPVLEETDKRLREADEELASLSMNGAPPDQLMRAKTNRLYASITNFYAREARALPDGHLPIELQALRIGETAFIAVPAEVFVEIGLKLKHLAPHRTFIVGLANGYIGYLPTREAYQAGGYEVVSAKCAAEAEDTLIKKALELEERLFAPDGNESAALRSRAQ
jgi:neutral ceramidase